MCTYEDLVAATLPYGLSPLVVPQLKTITLGGAVTGLGIESASFRNGLPHESVLEMDILTGAGEVLTASPRPARRPVSRVSQFVWHAGLFGPAADRAGAGQAVRRAAAPALPLVDGPGRGDGPHHRHRRPRRPPVDYLDGVVFSADESYLCLGVRTATPGPVSDYTGQDIYYRSIQHDADSKEDRLTIHDYLWRWDTDWFWCSGPFGAQNPPGAPVLAAALPAQQLLLEADRATTSASTSPTGSRSATVDRRASGSCRTSRCRSNGPREFLDWFLDNVPIEPIWLCPLRLRDHEGWPLYPIRPGRTYVNVGFWSSVPVGPTEGADQPADRGARSASSTGTSRCTPTPTTRRRSSTNSTAARRTRRSRRPTIRIPVSSTSTQRRCNGDDDVEGAREKIRPPRPAS